MAGTAPMLPATPPPAGASDPGRIFALRLLGGTAGDRPAQPLSGRIEHVMSGRCADFADATELIEALNRLTPAPERQPPPADDPRHTPLFHPPERTTTMNPETVRSVRESWTQVAAAGPAAAALFYEQLFAADPSLRLLFRSPMDEQGERLLKMLGLAVHGLAEPERLLPTLRALGERHLRYGVRDAHYATVGTALLRTLELALGDAFTPAVRAAWTEVYGLVAQTMREAADRVAFAGACDATPT